MNYSEKQFVKTWLKTPSRTLFLGHLFRKGENLRTVFILGLNEESTFRIRYNVTSNDSRIVIEAKHVFDLHKAREIRRTGNPKTFVFWLKEKGYMGKSMDELF